LVGFWAVLIVSLELSSLAIVNPLPVTVAFLTALTLSTCYQVWTYCQLTFTTSSRETDAGSLAATTPHPPLSR